MLLIHRSSHLRLFSALVSLLLTLSACAKLEESPGGPLRLIDLFSAATIDDSSEVDAEPNLTQWLEASLRGWQGGPGSVGVEVHQNRLVGRSTSDVPLIHADRTLLDANEPDERDLVHAIEIRARISAGENMEVYFSGDDEVDLDRIVGMARGLGSASRTPIVPEDKPRTYVIKPSRAVTAAQTRHLIIRPTNVAGADFEIESVRLVFRREHLRGIPSGLGWHGMSEIYHESLVSRAPETVHYSLTLPARPRLDVALSTLEDHPVTFTVEVRKPGAAESSTILKRSVTRPHRWDTARVDLSAFANQRVDLSLRLQAADEGALGFWGSPVIRDLGAKPVDSPVQSVLVIVADTLRTDHLDLYGYGRPTAPILSRMAAQGAAFSQCVAQGMWTKVSFSSILSGLHPLTHGVAEFHDRLPATATTLAEIFREAGFATLSLSSIQFNGKFTNLHQGFEQLHESGSLPRDMNSKTAVHHVDRLLPWLEANREVPFFAMLHVADPHAPYAPYAPYDRTWVKPGASEEFQDKLDKVLPVIADPLMRRFELPTSEELEQVNVDPASFASHELNMYDGSIRGMDAEIGRIFERLRELGLEDKVLVAFLSDHGTEFLEHGRHWHGHSVYGEIARVPLVLKGPGVPRGQVHDANVQTIDLMPTLLEIAGLTAPEGLQGRSLTPLMRGESPRPLPAFSFKAALTGTAGPPPTHTESLAMISGEWKLVRHTSRQDDGPEFELFQHRQDPLNLKDVAPDHAEIVKRMAAEMAAWRTQVEAAKLAGEEALDEVSAEELERLRSLGYVN